MLPMCTLVIVCHLLSTIRSGEKINKKGKKTLFYLSKSMMERCEHCNWKNFTHYVKTFINSCNKSTMKSMIK